MIINLLIFISICFLNWLIIHLSRYIHYMRSCSVIRVQLWNQEGSWPEEFTKKFLQNKALFQVSLRVCFGLVAFINIVLALILLVNLFSVGLWGKVLAIVIFIVTLNLLIWLPIYFQMVPLKADAVTLLKNALKVEDINKWVGKYFIAVLSYMFPKWNLQEIHELEHYSNLDLEVHNLDESRLLVKMRKFENTLVEDILTPKAHIETIEVEASVIDAIKLVETSGCSRLPVYREDLNNIVGVLYAKDLLKVIKKDLTGTIPDFLIKPVMIVADDRLIKEVFLKMQKRKIHLAMVVDKFGCTVGLITLEDILEELFGEILDEFDFDEEEIFIINKSTYLMDASVRLEKVEKLMQIEFERKADYDTLGGFILHKAQKVPGVGEEVIYNGWALQIQERSPRAIEKVLVSWKEVKENE